MKYYEAPAKVNLFLRLLREREDGFTEIDTLILPLDLADRLGVELCPEGPLLECDDPSLPTDGSNLVLRAAKAFERRVPGGASVRFVLEKKIPHGAGLAGGSSDAAAALRALNELFGNPLEISALANIGVELGSDVPVFLYQTACRCTGRGENVTPLADGHAPPPLTFLLVKPAFPVSTAWAYSAWRLGRKAGLPPAHTQTLAGGFELINDLEPPVFRKHLILEVAKEWLRTQVSVSGALMSGSGSTLFAIVENDACAEHLKDRFAGEFGDSWWSAICHWIPARF